MSRENVELVRMSMFPDGVDLVALTASGELASSLDLAVLAPEIEVAFATPGVGFTEYRGLDGFLEGWGDWMIPWARSRWRSRSCSMPASTWWRW